MVCYGETHGERFVTSRFFLVPQDHVLVPYNRLTDLVPRDPLGVTLAQRSALARSFVAFDFSMQGLPETERAFTPTRQKQRFHCSSSRYILLLIAPPGPPRGFSVSG